MQQISGKVEFNSAKTALETIEGVDPDEWVCLSSKIYRFAVTK